MRRVFIAGNWKMYKTIGEAEALAGELVGELSSCHHTLMIAPPFTALKSVSDVLKGSNILLGAQNMCSQVEGAHTGEVSVRMLKDLGVGVVILGHSERRHVYGETDGLIHEKVLLALEHGMDVILCVGETLEERESGRAKDVVGGQLTSGLKEIKNDQMEHITIAYEPVWAIGTGKTATPDDANEIHEYIRSFIGGILGSETAENTTIQYGGSVKPDNIRGLMAMEHIDGALVGGASLKAETFVPIALYDK